jgi:hypothetical protein
MLSRQFHAFYLVSDLKLLSSLDSIGIAGFSHDFGALAGKRDDVIAAFEELSEGKFGILDVIQVLFGSTIPAVCYIPSDRQRTIARLNAACGVLARNLLSQTRTETGTEKGDRSIMGLLIKAEETMQEEEVIAQVLLTLLSLQVLEPDARYR